MGQVCFWNAGSIIVDDQGILIGPDFYGALRTVFYGIAQDIADRDLENAGRL